MILPQKIENSYSGFFILTMISCTDSRNHFGFLHTSCITFNRLQCYQILSSYDTRSFLKIFYVTKPRYLAKKDLCLLQNLKFLTMCKAISKVMAFIKSRFTFFNKKTIYHLMFSWISWLHSQQLMRSRVFASSIIVKTG